MSFTTPYDQSMSVIINNMRETRKVLRENHDRMTSELNQAEATMLMFGYDRHLQTQIDCQRKLLEAMKGDLELVDKQLEKFTHIE